MKRYVIPLVLVALTFTLAGCNSARYSSAATLNVITIPARSDTDRSQEFIQPTPEARNRIVAELVKSGPLDSFGLIEVQGLANEGLLTEPSVIGALIAVLEREIAVATVGPEGEWIEGTKGISSDFSTALNFLHQLTGRYVGHAVLSGRETSAKSVRQVGGWWSSWWTQNRDKHPMFDAELSTKVCQRLVNIENKLLKDLAADYPEIGYLQSNGLVRCLPDSSLVLDSSTSSGGIHRRGPDGKYRRATEEDHTFLRIAIAGTTPLPPWEISFWEAVDFERLQRIRPRMELVFYKGIPGTGLVIFVGAGPKGSDFARRVRRSLSTLP